MSALFPRWTNTVARVSVAALLGTPVVALGGLFLYQRTPFITGQGNPITQPIEFDHRHHVGDEGIDCRYCHQTVERSPSAGMPSTAVCMNCHSQIWNKSPLLDAVRQAYFTDRPIAWNRVHDLPDHVYFNHAIHVGKGVGCVTCHGRVDEMAAVHQEAPLTMGWCLDCHRDPTPHLRPLEHITDLAWTKSTNPPATTPAPEVQTRTHCSTCHR
jgi:hypothetical protein